jgi:predicted RNA binding protein YcfA (HicA-like mRNA interferase family)
MTPLSGKAFARIVERHGWELFRVKGSHHIYGKPGSVVRLSIPIHGNNSLQNRTSESPHETGRSRRKRSEIAPPKSIR